MKDAQAVVSLVPEFFDQKPADFLIGVAANVQKTNFFQVTVMAIGNREEPKELIHENVRSEL